MLWKGAIRQPRLSRAAVNPGAIALCGLLKGNLEDRLAWIGAADVEETLGGRERASGNGGFIWDGGRIDARPAHPTKILQAGALLVADWSQVVLGLWGGGLTVEFNPYANFQAGITGARCVVVADVVLTNAGAAAVSTSIT